MHELESKMLGRGIVNLSLPRDLFEDADKLIARHGYHVRDAFWKVGYGVKLICTLVPGEGQLIGDGDQFPVSVSNRTESFLWKASSGGHGYPADLVSY